MAASGDRTGGVDGAQVDVAAALRRGLGEGPLVAEALADVGLRCRPAGTEV